MWRETMIHSALLKLQMGSESAWEIIDSVTSFPLKTNKQGWDAPRSMGKAKGKSQV